MPTTQNPEPFDAVSIALLHVYRSARGDFFNLPVTETTREHCIALEQKIFALAVSDYFAVSRIIAALSRIAERTGPGEQNYYAALLLADSPLFDPKIKQGGHSLPPDEDPRSREPRENRRDMRLPNYPTQF